MMQQGLRWRVSSHDVLSSLTRQHDPSRCCIHVPSMLSGGCIISGGCLLSFMRSLMHHVLLRLIRTSPRHPAITEVTAQTHSSLAITEV